MVPCFTFGWISISLQGTGDGSSVVMYMIRVSVSVANNFVHSQTLGDSGYHSFGELARFVFCFLQKIKEGPSLPLVEKWEQYVLANHSKFPPIATEEFLTGTRVLAALKKIGSSYLKRKF